MKFAHLGAILFVATLSVVPPLPATAKTITLIGPRSCSYWLKNRGSEKTVPYSSIQSIGAMSDSTWLFGFVSGYNAAYPTDKNLLAEIDADTISLWMDRYCADNPKSDLYNGTHKLFEELQKITR